MSNKHSQSSTHDVGMQSYILTHLNKTVPTHLKENNQGINDTKLNINISEDLIKKSKILLKDK